MEGESFISDIFNYCDRWCERCDMAAKCRLGTDEQGADRQAPAPVDSDNEQFWERVKSNLEKTRELLEEYLEKEGITISIEELERSKEDEKAIEEKMDANPLNKASQDYAMDVHGWFDARAGLFDVVRSDLETAARLELPGSDPAEIAARLNEAVDVIRWYHIQIAAKVSRAFSSRIEDEGDEIMAQFPSDSDGSAKVALIGIDRSLASWGVLRDYFDDGAKASTEDTEADVIFDIMVNLDKIRRALEGEFPEARAFQRPGFDD